MAEKFTDSYRVQRCCCFSRNDKALEMRKTLRGILALYVCSFLLTSLKLMLLAIGTQSRWSSDLVQSVVLVSKDEGQCIAKRNI